MTTIRARRVRSRTAALVVVAAAAGLAGCGGGGGDGGTTPDPGAMLEINASNRDAVSQAVVGSRFALGSAGGLPGTGALGSDERAYALAAGAAPGGAVFDAPQWLAAAALQRAHAAARRNDPGRARVLATIGPETEPCAFSGSLTATLDDRDNDGDVSAGDTVTMTVQRCVEVQGVELDGSMTMAVTLLRETQTSLSLDARMEFGRMTATVAGSTARLDGATRVEVRVPSSNSVSMRMVVDGTLSATVATPKYSDTVTYANGFVSATTVDVRAGRVSMTMDGTMASTRAAGSFTVATIAPVVALARDLYPTSGTVRASGSRGTVLLTVLSSSQVRLDLDADGNGSYEDSKTVAWSTLL